jgi:hypothetical protein
MAMRWLIVVARDEPGLYDCISRDNCGDDSVVVITDRRKADRRQCGAVRSPERRQADRRRRDIERQLTTKGWAEIRLGE